ncbi:hypothetical protein BCR34DRAFT_587116 [Clohesyomyces aquaticus]|uniref:CBM-cenC domain-containing protein n=1 Tax=Clohesyomyces aquaticus TaxID=1231657 RepID=A0A1Y1ZQY7_9PLEO|nr:hypothetical protein BCR34DRAFT_587116 [Clohesyomyces aquaticus]
MRFTVACVAAAAFAFVSGSADTATATNRLLATPTNDHLLTSPTPDFPESRRRASRTPKKPKFTKRPRPHHNLPHHHPTDCTNTELVTNGDFNRNVKNWEWIPSSRSQFFWVRDSRKLPSHSGAGQAYIFLNRGPSGGFLTNYIPAVEFGNTITVSAWLRYEPPADLSGCTIAFGDNASADTILNLTPQWTKYTFESPGIGRPTQVQFRIRCSSDLPITVLLDDVSATACVPKNPNPACQVLRGSPNYLVNGGFECPDGILAWVGTSYFGFGNESIAQLGGESGNPTHSGTGMAGFLLDNSQVPFSGVLLYQFGINHDMTRASSMASFWLSVDSKLNRVDGCLLNVATSTGTYILDQDISTLTTAWKKFEVKSIQPTTLDTFYIGISQCTSPEQPLIYIDDIFFGVDPAAGPAPTTTTTAPTSVPTPGPCGTVPTLVDPSFEIGDTSNWLFNDFSDNFDATFLVDGASTYGTPHAGSNVGVLTFSSGQSYVTLMQQLDGLCNGEIYTSTVWLQVASGYDASRCKFTYGITSSSGPITPSPAGTWTKVELVFLANIDSTSIFPYVYISAICQGAGEMVVLVDDVAFGPPPPCSITPSISDGSFESGDLTPWNVGFAEGDETAVITTSKEHTGTKSVLITFPSTANGAGFFREFAACVGQKLTFRFWYFVPKAYKGIPCSVSASAWYTGEYILDDIVLYDTWVEAKLDFIAGAPRGHIDFGVGCRNQLQKVVVYLDDVSVTKR